MSVVNLRYPVSDTDHKIGREDAPVILLEYGDYQCPHCRQAHPIIKEALRAYGEQMLFVFRNFPLMEIHKEAKLAAMAAESAGLAGKYFQMHDLIFENQEFLSKNTLIALAARLGLKLDEFERNLESEKLNIKVLTDFEHGARTGVNGTPTFFVNGEKFQGNWKEGELFEYISQLV